VTGKVGVVGSGKAMTQSTSGPLIYKAKKLTSGVPDQTDLATMTQIYQTQAQAQAQAAAAAAAGMVMPVLAPGFVMSPWAAQPK